MDRFLAEWKDVSPPINPDDLSKICVDYLEGLVITQDGVSTLVEDKDLVTK